MARRARAARPPKAKSCATSCGTSSSGTSYVLRRVLQVLVLHVSRHLRASVGGCTRVLGVGSKATFAADRIISSGAGLASGSSRAAAYLYFLPPERLRLFFRRGKVMRDDGGGAALQECVDGLLYKVIRLGVQGRRGLVQQQHLGGSGGAGHGCKYLAEKVLVVAAVAGAAAAAAAGAAAVAVVVVVVVVRGGKLAFHSPVGVI